MKPNLVSIKVEAHLDSVCFSFLMELTSCGQLGFMLVTVDSPPVCMVVKKKKKVTLKKSSKLKKRVLSVKKKSIGKNSAKVQVKLKKKSSENLVNKKEIQDIISKDVKMGEDVMVQGTPTIFVNGIKDINKTKFEMLGDK